MIRGKSKRITPSPISLTALRRTSSRKDLS
jgi:hypothetical protein